MMNSRKSIPHGLYLVGCGPGDPELLTSAAHSVLVEADVLISDSLIYDSFKDRYENIIKRPRWQDELNKLILKHLSMGHTVARLKVGDVTLYARTKMESSLAVPTFLIPGISASTSSALYANVLTTSPCADRTVVVTGTLEKENMSSDLPVYDSETTLILLMALRKISTLCKLAIQNLKYPNDTPIVAIQRASQRDQRVVFSTLAEVASKRNPFEGLLTPVTFVVGHTVSSRKTNLKVWCSSTAKKLPSKLFLVGAGPGDPSLLSLKALRLVREADVVICDSLVLKPMSSLRDDMIVRPKKQSEVNALIRHYLSLNKSVVRLKTGDPCMYGRVSAELESVTKDTVYAVPGISTAMVASLYANILTTVRNIANRVVILSGVISGGRSGSSRVPMYNSKTTIVLMMCVRKIREFTQKMIENLNYPSDLGVAVVHKMSLKDQLVIHSDLCNIADAIRDQNMSSPAVFVIGHVTESRFGAGVGLYNSGCKNIVQNEGDETKMVLMSSSG